MEDEGDIFKKYEEINWKHCILIKKLFPRKL